MPPYIRPAILVLCCTLFAVGGWHRIRAHRPGEKIDRLQEGIPILISLRLSALAFFVAVIWWYRDPEALAWAELPLPETVRIAGLLLIAASAAWLIWMFRTLGRNLTDTVVTRSEAYLVTGGPYRFVRHPMYTGVFALTAGLSLAAANWALFLLGGLIFTLIAIRSQKEEANLEAKFGQPYRLYRQRTGRFFPRLLH